MTSKRNCESGKGPTTKIESLTNIIEKLQELRNVEYINLCVEDGPLKRLVFATSEISIEVCSYQVTSNDGQRVEKKQRVRKKLKVKQWGNEITIYEVTDCAGAPGSGLRTERF